MRRRDYAVPALEYLASVRARTNASRPAMDPSAAGRTRSDRSMSVRRHKAKRWVTMGDTSPATLTAAFFFFGLVLLVAEGQKCADADTSSYRSAAAARTLM